MSHNSHGAHSSHGLTCDEFDEMLNRADGRCEVCGDAPPDLFDGRAPLYIDHDHRRGTGHDHIRGLVCPKCNVDLRYVDAGKKPPSPAQARYLENAWFWTQHPSPSLQATLERGKRINVSINAASLASIDLLIEREGIGLTEAVQRLVKYGGMVYRTTRVENSELLIQHADGPPRGVIFL